MKSCIAHIILIISLFITTSITAQDSLKTPIQVLPHIGADFTNVGSYGSIGAQFRYNKIVLSLSYLIDYSKTNFPFDGPFGLAISTSYFPNYSNDKVINHFINLDYRITFHERSCTYDCSQKYNKAQEINAGYGLSIRIFKRVFISNSINVGWFFENSLSDRTSKTITNNGSNTLISSKLNFLINK